MSPVSTLLWLQKWNKNCWYEISLLRNSNHHTISQAEKKMPESNFLGTQYTSWHKKFILWSLNYLFLWSCAKKWKKCYSGSSGAGLPNDLQQKKVYFVLFLFSSFEIKRMNAILVYIKSTARSTHFNKTSGRRQTFFPHSDKLK